jgi:hypothetical protein
VPGTVTASGLPATAGSGDSVTAVGVITPEPAPRRVSARVTAAEGARGASEAQRTASLPRHSLRAGGSKRQQQPQSARHHTPSV